ncbi:hypothetical protein GGR51DRAFT_559498 [Nemania sp. FL0031]|nr:hypothetical protein GGR51DRAFT_559498 [Nemania sp. FL0031]
MATTDDVSPLPDWFSADLEEAIKDCRQACGSPPANDVGSNYTWLLAEGEWATMKFKAFSQHAHLFPRLQEHMSIVMLPLTSSGAIACGGIKEPKTLTEACLWLKRFQQDNCIRLIVTCSPFSQHSSLEPRHASTYLKDMRRKQVKAEDVYESALIAFLFLAKKYCVFGLHDLYQLVASITGHEDEEEDFDTLGLSKPSSIQCPPCELCLVPSTEDTGLWNSVSSHFEPLIPFNSSTKILKFPSSFPQLSTEFYFMERYRPHATPPVLSRFSREARRCRLASHWVEGLHHLYHLGLNNYHIILRRGVRHLHGIKYGIAAKPNVGAAHICLTYLNQLEYQRRLLVLLQANLETFPNAWAVPQNPSWVEGIGKSCETLVMDNKVTEGKARTIRQQIMEQLSLAQSTGHRYLTMLAMAFVPISAVVAIFGMNAREINGSAWPIKYFVILAVSLTVALVLLPLIASSTGSFDSNQLGRQTQSLADMVPAIDLFRFQPRVRYFQVVR